MTGALTTPSSGSSPHARGTRYYVAVGILSGRFIPACAGNTPIRRRPKPPQQVHPRMCGDTRCGTPLTHPPRFIPHARGTHQLTPMGDHADWLIPACAGNALASAHTPLRASVHPRVGGERTRISTYALRASVHPRVRGERTRISTYVIESVGSSPHARGTRYVRCRRHPQRSVHPRMRGEHGPPGMPLYPYAGSSPHARGTHPARPHHHERRRYHPRMRGEHTRGRWRGRGRTGSSPHARGTLGHHPRCAGIATVHPRMRGEHIERSTPKPAAVGSSPHARGTRMLADVIRCRLSTVHPRMRGEHVPGMPFWTAAAPVHPRMRGEHCRSGCDLGSRRRFIPACAGNTLRREY